MVYDCFIFFNELEVLDIRLNTLDSVVDKFVICESTKDHANRPKSLYFAKNRKRFKKFKDKIIYIKVDDSPNTNLVWIHVDHQWQAIARGLKNCKANDTILISDVDEIPRPEKIKEWINKPGEVKIFLQSLSYYFLNCVAKSSIWEGTRMMKYKDAKKYRMHTIKHLISNIKIPDGGWHFSFMGGIKRIQTKIKTTGHQEYNTERYTNTNNITLSIAEGRDFLHRGLEFKILDKTFLPVYVRDHDEKFKNMLINNFQQDKYYYPFKQAVLKIEYNFHMCIAGLKKALKDLLKK